MRIAVVSPPIDISGGMKQKLLLARALAGAGHAVDIVTPDAAGFAAFGYTGRAVTPEAALAGPRYDVSLITWFETHALAVRLSDRVVHFCQGHEGDLVHLAPRRAEIEALYAAAFPTLVVSPHLALRLAAEHGTVTAVMPPLLDAAFRPAFARFGPARVPEILVHGIYESAVKRVAPAVDAVEIVRRDRPLRLLRISNFPQSAEETARSKADRYLRNVLPAEVARLTARADVALFTSEAGEGFGLPVLESLAAGVPVVAVRIPSLGVFEHLGAVRFVHAAEPQLLAAALRDVIEPATWRRMRRRGLAVARLWRDGQAARAADAFGHLLAATR